MPFKSEKQKAYLYAYEPKVAKEFQKHTPANAKLPYRVGDKSKRGDKRS